MLPFHAWLGGFTSTLIIERFSRAGPRGRGREWATLGVYPLSWLLSNNRLEEVCGTLTTGTFSSRLLLSNQDKGCTPSVAHSLPLPLGPALLNLWNIEMSKGEGYPKTLCYLEDVCFTFYKSVLIFEKMSITSQNVSFGTLTP